jgi:hypothetical protein
MRGIPLRAWPKTDKVMLEVGSLFFETGGLKGLYKKGDHFMHQSNYVLMQFTGLKDKYGKEIYEGDVVKGTVYDDLEVCWGKDGWILRRRDEDLFPLGALQKQNIEVIGNIYESPELLG